MNSTMSARIDVLKNDLERLETLQDGAQEASQLIGLLDELQPHAGSLKQHCRQRRLLNEIGAEISSLDKLSSASRTAQTLAEKFSEARKSSTLKKGKTWAKFVDQMKQAEKELEKDNARSWERYRGSLFTGFSPSSIEGQIAATAENIATLKRYREKFEDFSEESAPVPDEREKLRELRELASNLEKIAKNFDFNVPPSVKVFLEAIQQGGASLGLLNDEVEQWLETNSAFDHYRIVPARI